jgi:hypothetical protein
MNKSLNAFVERQNVLHYMDLLKSETNLAKREVYFKLLAEAEAKQSAAEQQRATQ